MKTKDKAILKQKKLGTTRAFCSVCIKYKLKYLNFTISINQTNNINIYIVNRLKYTMQALQIQIKIPKRLYLKLKREKVQLKYVCF